MLQITTKAKIYLTNYCRDVDSNGITLEVRAGGCAGYKFVWREKVPTVLNDYEEFPLASAESLFVDKQSLELVQDSVIDVNRTAGGTSIVINNPLAASSCGCGLSFSV